MKIRFLQDFSAQTASGARLIAAGTVLDLDEAKAAPLIRAGVAEPAGRDPPGTSSPAAVDLLAAHVVTIRAAGGELIHLTDAAKERDRLERAGLIVFSSAEVAELQKDPEAVPALLIVKAGLPGAVILENKPHKEGPNNGEQEDRKSPYTARAVRLPRGSTGRAAPDDQGA